MSSNANLAINVLGYQQLFVTGTPQALTFPNSANGLPTNPEHVTIRCTGQPVRWLAGPANVVNALDGVSGIPLLAGETLAWLDPFTNWWGTLKTIKFVKDTTATASPPAILEILYYQ